METEERKKIVALVNEHRFSKVHVALIMCLCQFVSERLESDVGSLVYEYLQHLLKYP